MELAVDMLTVTVSAPYDYEDEDDTVRTSIEERGEIVKVVELVTGQ